LFYLKSIFERDYEVLFFSGNIEKSEGPEIGKWDNYLNGKFYTFQLLAIRTKKKVINISWASQKLRFQST